jgi:hypothetical protein
MEKLEINGKHGLGRRHAMQRNAKGEPKRVVAIDWGEPPQAPVEHSAVAAELVVFVRMQRAGDKAERIALGLLDKMYLTSLQLLLDARGFGDLGALRGNQLCYIYRRYLATLLGWDERCLEG